MPGTKSHFATFPESSVSRHYNQMKVRLFPSSRGDLGPSLSDQRALEMTKSAEETLENLSPDQTVI